MEVLLGIIIPLFIILPANIFSYECGSKRYNFVTGIFGWATVIVLVIWLLLYFLQIIFVVNHYNNPLLPRVLKILNQFWLLGIITVVSRDYETILKPRAHHIEKKIKDIYLWFKNKLT